MEAIRAQNELSYPDAVAVLESVVANVGKVIRGKEPVVRQALACWLAGGHALFEDVPGTGKTMLARALARSVNVSTHRLQMTPDLLPADVIGSPVYSKEKGFVFVPGPIFTSVLVVDELNRATPRTQSALLEAMAEKQCTAEKRTMPLPSSFFVVATQNPVDQHGTFPLPEAQLDRFMMRIAMGYPEPAEEMRIVRDQLLAHPIDSLGAVTDEPTWEAVRELVKSVAVSDSVLTYAMALVERTRENPQLSLGASPRATIALIRCAQAFSLMYGESYVKPDFVKYVAPAILTHRIFLTPRARLEGATAESVVTAILRQVTVPVK